MYTRRKRPKVLRTDILLVLGTAAALAAVIVAHYADLRTVLYSCTVCGMSKVDQHVVFCDRPISPNFRGDIHVTLLSQMIAEDRAHSHVWELAGGPIDDLLREGTLDRRYVCPRSKAFQPVREALLRTRSDNGMLIQKTVAVSLSDNSSIDWEDLARCLRILEGSPPVEPEDSPSQESNGIPGEQSADS